MAGHTAHSGCFLFLPALFFRGFFRFPSLCLLFSSCFKAFLIFLNFASIPDSGFSWDFVSHSALAPVPVLLHSAFFTLFTSLLSSFPDFLFFGSAQDGNTRPAQ